MGVVTTEDRAAHQASAVVEPMVAKRGFDRLMERLRQPRNLKYFLIVYAFSIVGLLAVVLSLFVWYRAQDEERRISQDAVHRARSVAARMDVWVVERRTILSLLAETLTDDLPRFRDMALKITPPDRSWWVVLSRLDTREQVVNTFRADFELNPGTRGTPLSERGIEASGENAQPSDVFVSPLTKDWAVTLSRIIRTGGEPKYLLSLVMPASRIADVLAQEASGKGDDWVLALTGRDGRLIARSSRHAERVGQKALWIEETRAQNEGVKTGLTGVAGIPIIGAWARNEGGWTTTIAVPMASLRDTDHSALVMLMAVMISATILLTLTLGGVLRASIRKLRHNAHKLSQGQDMRDTSRTMVVEINETLDVMREAAAALEQRQTLQAELLRASRLSEIGRMAAALAHELNQPLSAVAAYIGGCRRMLRNLEAEEGPKQKLQAVMEQAGGQALRAGEIIRRLREFIGTGQGDMRIENATRVITEGTTLAFTSARHNGVSIHCDIRSTANVLVDRIQIQQVIFNLMRNAIEAMETTSRKELRIEASERADMLAFSVTDTGAGVAPEIADRLFKPFSTTKGDGMGVGLSVCREIVEAHGGKIWAEANPAGGTVFRFTLPILEQPAST